VKIHYNILIGLLLVLTFSSCNSNYDFIQEIKSPDGKYNFCLYAANEIKDEDFMVLKLEENINPKSVKIDLNNKDTVSQKNADWVLSRQIFSNYEESSAYASNPKIDLISNRFLVFSRGGYYFGLCDLKLNKDTFNNCCPFCEWEAQNIWAEKGIYYKGDIPKDEKSDYGLWVKKNIHNKIKNYIVINK
jgi:hypothetical protein